MMKYFTLRESNDERRHIATVGVNNTVDSITAIKMFNEAIVRALTEHFDEECKLAEELNPVNYVGTDPHDISFSFAYDGEDPHNEQFEIEQTWLYE